MSVSCAVGCAQVMVDSQGLMKVMHMITVHAAGEATQRGVTQGTTTQVWGIRAGLRWHLFSMPIGVSRYVIKRFI